MFGAGVNGRDMWKSDIARVALAIAIQPQAELQKMNVPFLMDLLPDGENRACSKSS